MSGIHQPEDLGVLRFITAGSVDDGKSTLIGRLHCRARRISVLLATKSICLC
jgi:sulfate adenylyltransferase subunit 1 (EFTu-like GTPase family)